MAVIFMGLRRDEKAKNMVIFHNQHRGFHLWLEGDDEQPAIDADAQRSGF
jgi:hypothetical protein